MHRFDLVAGLALVFVATSAPAAEWRHAAGDPSGSGTGSGAGAISTETDELPGIAWQIPMPALSFSVDAFFDVDGDGTDEVLRPFRGGVGAISLPDGTSVWVSPGRGITQIVGLADVDGDGDEDDVVAVGDGMGGGVHVIDARSGALTWSFTDLALGSGVHRYEVNVADLDGDDADELVFTGSLAGTTELLVADLSDPAGDALVSIDLNGEYLQLTRHVAGDFDGDGVPGELAVLQGDDLDLFALCSPADADAVCAPDADLCLCHEALVDAAFPLWTFPFTPFVTDADGDGDDEIATVHQHPVYADGVGVVDPTDWFTGAADPELGGWLYEYSGQAERTIPSPAMEPADLTGDGLPELLVSILNPAAGEIGLDGDPVDDGLEHEGFVTAVVSAADGTVLASLPDAYAHGRFDLDGDGDLEILVETTDGWVFTGGGLQGWDLVCAAECTFELAWSAPDHRLTRFTEVFDNAFLPSSFVVPWDSGELVTFTATGLQLLGYGGGEPVAGASIELTDDVGVAGLSGAVAVTTDAGVVSVYDEALAPIGTITTPPSEDQGRWIAVVPADSESRAVAFLNGHAFVTEEKPGELTDADFEVLPRVALGQDVDGDGFTDVFSWDYDTSSALLTVARHEFDAGLDATEVWSWTADDSLRLLQPPNDWPFTAADFDGDGVEDLALGAQFQATIALIVLDGATGAMQWTGGATSRDAVFHPLGAYDALDGDGTLELVRPSRAWQEIWRVGETDPADEAPIGTSEFNGAFADLDDDGTPELLMARLGAVADPEIEAWDFVGGLARRWGPVALAELPPAVEQALVAGDLDGVAGADILYGLGSGGLGAASGVDGSPLTGFPIRLAAGKTTETAPQPREPTSALIRADIDGDGTVEAIAGSGSGWLYAVDVTDPAGPLLEWSFTVGGAVTALATADVDGDGAIELLVSTRDGVARVIDGLGVAIEITAPEEGDCVAGETITVEGTSAGITHVALSVLGGEFGPSVAVEADGSWSTVAVIPLVDGLIEVEAAGLLGGEHVVSAVLAAQSQVDADADGVTVCGGDCDDEDPARAAGFEEICDGVDNDCDPSTDENEDGDGDGVGPCDGDCDDSDPLASPELEEDCEDGTDNDCDGTTDALDPDCEDVPEGDDDDDDDDAGGGCDACESSCSAASPASSTTPLALLLLAVARRRRR